MGARQELVTSSDAPPVLLPAPASTLHPLPPEEDASWFRDALKVVAERRRVLLAVIGLGAIALVAYAVMVPAPRVFEARAQLLIEPESSSPLDYGRPTPATDPEGSYYETQYRILRSRALVRRTLAALATPQPASGAATADTAAMDAIPTAAVDAFLRRCRSRTSPTAGSSRCGCNRPMRRMPRTPRMDMRRPTSGSVWTKPWRLRVRRHAGWRGRSKTSERVPRRVPRRSIGSSTTASWRSSRR